MGYKYKVCPGCALDTYEELRLEAGEMIYECYTCGREFAESEFHEIEYED